jgi:translocation and assembly module TamB
LLGLLALSALILVGAAGAFFAYLNSPAFERRAKDFVIEELERRTGAQVSLEEFDLALWDQRFRLEGLTLRGLEAPSDPPLAHLSRIDVGLRFRTLFQRRIDLFELTITQPEIRVVVGLDGRTNIPSPVDTGPRRPLDFRISIDNFNIKDGAAFFNERRVDVDLDLTNLVSEINFDGAAEVLSGHLRYDGMYQHLDNQPIPYTLDADLAYTRNTLLVQRMEVTSGETLFKLQGRVNELLTRNLAGRLEYTGSIQIPFLNYFFSKERFAGTAEAAGLLEFSRGYFFTRGTATSDAIEFEDWQAARLTTDYSYHYPEKRAAFRNLRAQIAGGRIEGSTIVENLPGRSRVLLDLDYAGIDAAALTRAYPWDPQYRIFSRMTGLLTGWFEGKLDRFHFTGNADMRPYDGDTAGLVPFPILGTTGYEAVPGQLRVYNADLQCYSTAIKADGLIHGENSDLRVQGTSSNLRELAFLYGDANGMGSFDGTLTGRIKSPVLDGAFTLDSHVFKGQWRIQHADGRVHLDSEAQTADLSNVRVTQGSSEIFIDGSAALSGSPVDLQLRTDRILGEDLAPFVNRKIGGTIAGSGRVTSLQPVRFEGDLRAEDLRIDNRLVGDTRAHVRYVEPVVDLRQLVIRQKDAALSGNVTYNQADEALKFDASVRSIDLNNFRDSGLPESISGVITQADIRGEGTLRRPDIKGEAVIEKLQVFGEEFPRVRAELASADTTLNVTLDAARNLHLTAAINTAASGYPFRSTATFTSYSLERVIGISGGTITVTGSASLSGLLTDASSLRGEGRIESADARLEDRTVRTTAPFGFDFNPDRLRVSGVTLTGAGTEIRLVGTIGFTPGAALGLDVSGRVDLGLFAAASPEWFANGSVNIEGRMSGTAQDPDLRGVARFSNATLGRRGFFTTLSALEGELFFDQNRVTVNNISGRVGGGTVRAQGAAVLDQRQLGSMNIRIDLNDVRFRYPEGLRTVVDGAVVLRGTSELPLLQGNLQVQSLSYESDFDEFLQLFQDVELDDSSSPLGRLGLALHVEGSQNITIRNQLADVEARVDVDISGTVDDPALTGHVEASGGTLFFQGTRYEITRGNIDFVDPLRIDPVVDIQAETELRDYRVILAISGRGDRLRLDMRSDPPLPQLEIVSLIAGGRTVEELEEMADRSGNRNIPTSEQLFQGGAASILFDLLQSRVGNRFGLLGLDRVRIDPFLVGAEEDPVTRITISEQITKDLSITYSQDLSSNRQQIILIEYFISRDTSVIASRDETGALGLDLKFRARFK